MISRQISIVEIEHNLKKFIKRVEAGERLVIMKAGRPLAEVKPFYNTSTKNRPFGLCEGDFTVPEDFDAPLPKAIVKKFEGK